MPTTKVQLITIGTEATAAGNLPELLFSGQMLPHAVGNVPPGVNPNSPIPPFDNVKRLFPLLAKVRTAITQELLLTFYVMRDILQEEINNTGLAHIFPTTDLNPSAGTGYTKADQAYQSALATGADRYTRLGKWAANTIEQMKSDFIRALTQLNELQHWREELWMIESDLQRGLCILGLSLDNAALEEAIAEETLVLGTSPIPPSPPGLSPFTSLLHSAAAKQTTADSIRDELRNRLMSKKIVLSSQGHRSWRQDQENRQEEFVRDLDEFRSKQDKLKRALSERLISWELERHIEEFEGFRKCLNNGQLNDALTKKPALDNHQARIDADSRVPNGPWVSQRTKQKCDIYSQNLKWIARHTINTYLTPRHIQDAGQYERDGDSAFRNSQFGNAKELYANYLRLFSMVTHVNYKKEAAERGEQQRRGKQTEFDTLLKNSDTMLETGTRRNVKAILGQLRAFLEKARVEMVECIGGCCQNRAPNAVQCARLIPSPLFDNRTLERMKAEIRKRRIRHWLYTGRYLFR